MTTKKTKPATSGKNETKNEGKNKPQVTNKPKNESKATKTREGLNLSKAGQDTAREANKRCKSLSSVVKLFAHNWEDSEEGKGYRSTLKAINIDRETAPTFEEVKTLISSMLEGENYYTFETARDSEGKAIKGHIVKKYTKFGEWSATRLLRMLDQATRREAILAARTLDK